MIQDLRTLNIEWTKVKLLLLRIPFPQCWKEGETFFISKANWLTNERSFKKLFWNRKIQWFQRSINIPSTIIVDTTWMSYFDNSSLKQILFYSEYASSRIYTDLIDIVKPVNSAELKLFKINTFLSNYREQIHHLTTNYTGSFLTGSYSFSKLFDGSEGCYLNKYVYHE